jgi:hypothetical protein
MGADTKRIDETIEDEPSPGQFPKNRGRALSPKVFLYDPCNTSLKVGNKKELDKGL